mgnify:CR=1 FL=1
MRRIAIVLDLDDVASLLQVLGNELSYGKAILADVQLGSLAHRAIVVEYVDDFQLVAFPDFMIIHIVGRRYLKDARSKLHFNIAIRYNWNDSSD